MNKNMLHNTFWHFLAESIASLKFFATPSIVRVMGTKKVVQTPDAKQGTKRAKVIPGPCRRRQGSSAQP